MSLVQQPSTAGPADNGASAAARRAERASPRRERVLEALREAIVVGRYEDGDRLIEDRIARELSTSRGPVREALRQLEHEGLVVSLPYRATEVLGISQEEIAEVLVPIRLTLETFAFEDVEVSSKRGILVGRARKARLF